MSVFYRVLRSNGTPCTGERVGVCFSPAMRDTDGGNNLAVRFTNSLAEDTVKQVKQDIIRHMNVGQYILNTDHLGEHYLACKPDTPVLLALAVLGVARISTEAMFCFNAFLEMRRMGVPFRVALPACHTMGLSNDGVFFRMGVGDHGSCGSLLFGPRSFVGWKNRATANSRKMTIAKAVDYGVGDKFMSHAFQAEGVGVRAAANQLPDTFYVSRITGSKALRRNRKLFRNYVNACCTVQGYKPRW